MDWKKLRNALFFPHPAVPLLLFPASVAAMLCAMLRLGEDHPVTIAAYVLAFYALTLCCLRIPALLRFLRAFRTENRYLRRWSGDPRLRMNVTVGCAVLWNGAYGALQLGLGIYHHSAWFYSLAAYYASLALMRFFLVRHTLRHEPGKEPKQELLYYRTCGWVFLPMNLALSGVMLYRILEDRMTPHHEITTIAMAAYTFTTLTMAIVNVVRYRKYNSPVLSASRAVSLAAACVSMLSLESTMLTTFGGSGLSPRTRLLFLALSGGALSLGIVAMAIYMIVNANRTLSLMEN